MGRVSINGVGEVMNRYGHKPFTAALKRWQVEKPLTVEQMRFRVTVDGVCVAAFLDYRNAVGFAKARYRGKAKVSPIYRGKARAKANSTV